MATILFRHDSIFDHDYDLLINPINAFGVSGKGLAKEFAKRFPNHQAFLRASVARRDQKRGGDVYFTSPHKNEAIWIAHLATKQHWREPSEISYVTRGLQKVGEVLSKHLDNIRTVGCPALGAGLGGLSWEEVHPEMVATIHKSFPSGVTVYIFPPR